MINDIARQPTTGDIGYGSISFRMRGHIVILAVTDPAIDFTLNTSVIFCKSGGRDDATRAAAAAATLAHPALAGRASSLTMIQRVALNSIDPLSSSSRIARNRGFTVFDLLPGRDAALNAQPQMVEADLMEDNAQRWISRLQDKLLWHDGEKALARDCVASLRRPAVALDAAQPGRRHAGSPADVIEAVADRSFVPRLNRPCPHPRRLLWQFIIPPVRMPERLAMAGRAGYQGEKRVLPHPGDQRGRRLQAARCRVAAVEMRRSPRRGKGDAAIAASRRWTCA